MTLLAPQWLWLFALFGYYLFYLFKSDRLALNKKTLALALAVIFAVIALSRPALQRQPSTMIQRGEDIILALDLSYSMRADDIKPNRLERAKSLIKALIRAEKEDRFGIIAFTTNAILLSPLSEDDTLLLELFDRLDEQLITTKGTSILPVLKLARKMSRAPKLKVILFSDGGDNESYATEAAYAKEHDMRVSIAMIATPSGATVTLPDGKLLEDSGGDIVITRANPAVAALAHASGGKYIDDASLAALLDITQGGEANFQSKKRIVGYFELFYPFIALSLLFTMLALTTLGTRLFAPLLAFLTLLGVDASASMFDFYHLSNANDDYTHKRYKAAAANFLAIDSPKARFNAAGSYYKAGEYEKALALYLSLKSGDARFKSAIFFNAANCYIRLRAFQKARDMLLQSLALYPTQEAKENLLALINAEEQERSVSGRQKGKKRVNEAAAKNSQASKKRKEGGSSNMQVDAQAGNGAQGKKIQGDPRLNFAASKSRLSSKQYELINKRSVHEVKPW